MPLTHHCAFTVFVLAKKENIAWLSIIFTFFLVLCQNLALSNHRVKNNGLNSFILYKCPPLSVLVMTKKMILDDYYMPSQ